MSSNNYSLPGMAMHAQVQALVGALLPDLTSKTQLIFSLCSNIYKSRTS